MNDKIRLSFLSFLITFALLFPISALVFSQFAQPAEKTVEAADAQLIYQIPKEQDLVALLTESDRMGNDAELFLLLRISAHDNMVSVCNLPKDTVTVVGSKTGTLSELFAWGGTDAARKAAENLTFLSIDKTIHLDDQGIAEMIDELGGLEMTLETSVDSSGIHLDPGRQFLDGARFCAVFKQDPEQAIQALAGCFNEKTDLEGLFSVVAQQAQTNITAYDLTLRKDGWQQMMRRHNAQYVAVQAEFEQTNGRHRMTEQSKEECQKAFEQ